MTDRTCIDLSASIRLVRAHAGDSAEDGHAAWPLRVGAGSALGAETAEAVLAEYVSSFADELAADLPASLAALCWRSSFAAETIERHSGFFSRGPHGGRPRKTAYDEMAAAFPALTRLLAPLLLGQALQRGVVELRALELVALNRKLPVTRLVHAHRGKSGCGCTLNALALVAHLRIGGEARCAVLGSLPLPYRMDLLRSCALASESLLFDLHLAASLLGNRGAARELLDCPVVVDMLYAGGPCGRGARMSTDTELVAGRSLEMLKAVHRPREAPVRRKIAPAVPTHRPDTCVRRRAPTELAPASGSWPKTSEGFVSAYASIDLDSGARAGVPVRVTRVGMGSGGMWRRSCGPRALRRP